ncbi:hypothetical protein NUU61_000662 [Penicillium alfredii]|uniref:Cell wall protein n=1 Tax=Penicillium alfredii TaxID=1506179 RepID=A0A9W9GAI3_9EURO|nr:uncharacterized protein NUU61_000662 [Penicillium alfredii]KAJ5114903.1 hypothetical protein NUU61_000662 [Penicillium alfredii]
MRSGLVLLATLAASSIAFPTDVTAERRTLKLGADIGANIGGGIGADVELDIGAVLDAVLGGGVHASVSLLAGLGAKGAAALQGGALGCSAGKIHAGARKELKAWLLTQAHIGGSLKTSLLKWCEGDESLTLSAEVVAALSVYIPMCADIAAKEQIYVTIDGIFDAGHLESALVLGASVQASVSEFLHGAADLDIKVKAGLSLCASGGVVTSLSADIKAGLLAWLSGDDCTLSAGLKATVIAWIHGHENHGLVQLGHLSKDALSAVSVGASVGVHVEESGHLSVGAQSSLSAFLNAHLSADLDVDVRTALKACAKGDLASSLSVDARTALAIWLSGSKCSLGVELKAVVLLWLSLAVSAEASVDLVTGLIGDITAFLSETVLATLSVDLRGALSLLAAGESLTSLSFSTRAELAAFIGGCTGLHIDMGIQIIIIQWFTGCSIPGGPKPSGSKTPSLPGPSSTGVPSGPAPSGPAPTGPVPTGPVPSGSVPSGSGSTSTPCDTSVITRTSLSTVPDSTSPAPSDSNTPSGPGATESPAPSGSGQSSTSVAVPPAPTTPPTESSTGPVTVTVTKTKTICPCK